MALLLALARKVTLSNKLVQSGRWEVPPVMPLRRLEGQVLGPDRLRQHPARARAQGQGVRPAGDHARSLCDAGGAGGGGVEDASFETLLGSSDFVSVHAPLMPATRGLMNAAAFAKMKKGALLINTARGPLVDEAALVAALDSGHLGGAALDVVTTEPLAKDSPLIGRDNVILTPHTAFYSVEALEELQTKCASDVARVLSGEKAVYPISA